MKTLRALVGPLLVLSVLVAALGLLHNELRHYHLSDFTNGLADIPLSRTCLALGLTVLNYTVLIGYDLLGIRYIRHPIPFPRVALASFLGYAVGHSVGSLLGGSTIRYRLYTAWGLSAVEIVKLVLILSVTFWMGFFALAGLVFVLDPLPIPERLQLPVASTIPLGMLLGSLAIAYQMLCVFRRSPLKLWRWEFMPPPITISVPQCVLGMLDLMLAASVLYVLMPASVGISYPHLLAVYLLALVTAILTQVPGGLGVFELVFFFVLAPSEPHRVVVALLVYRAVYYLIPLAVAVLLLGGTELSFHRRKVGKVALLLGRWTRFTAPRLLAITLFVAGTVLLFSGATPAADGRIRLLRRVLPLPVLEASHLLGSIIGILLILMARGLQRRVETAYYAAVALLLGGIVFSLLKGLDFEEAILLGVMLLIFLPCRQHFYRQGALLSERLSLRWFAAIALVIACTLWIMLFAYSHLEYKGVLWWQFAFDGHAPRSLRAMASVTLLLLVFTSARLLRTQPRFPKPPTADDLQSARKIVARSPRTASHLALLGDKRFLFNEDRSAFLMYGIEGRSWVAMGDPVGDEAQIRELAWNFRELCDVGARWPVFYQVDEDRVPVYVDMGLTLVKLGEEARVPLTSFTLEGSAQKNLRHANRHLADEGCTFEIVEPELDDALVGELREVSDAWLAEKRVAEKGFSLGYFRPDYIRHCPVALVRRGGRIIALANIWRGANKAELSVDLMRYLPDAPQGVMEFLFTQLMLQGRQEGYEWFNLGMAPLSGIEAQALAPLWNRIASLAYRHGEHFYNFRGLRQYKQKFHPVWTAKYLASPGGLALPIILTNVASLVSGGLAELITK